MLVRCPKCRTTYKVSDEILKGSAPVLRCSRCKHTFELPAHSPAQVSQAGEPDDELSQETAAHGELKLPFETGSTEHAAPEGNKIAPEDVQPPGESAAGDDEKPEAWSLSDPGKDEDRPFILPADERPTDSGKAVDPLRDFPDDDPFFARTDNKDSSADSNHILALSSYIDQRASILPFLTLFGLLLIGFSVLAVISYAHPQISEKVIKEIPLVGTSVLRNERLKEGIVIQSLASSYQTIQGNREVFMVTGVVLNQNPTPVREIQLSGIAYNQAGKELERQTIWVGNTISPKIIRGMTAEDIPNLQNLKPLKSFEVPSGDSMPFTIVFLRSAKNAKQFSCEVLAAEGDI